MENRKAIVTGDILKEKASATWKGLPQYEGIQEPKWSNRWLHRFKGRFEIKEFVQYREVGSAAINNPSNIK